MSSFPTVDDLVVMGSGVYLSCHFETVCMCHAVTLIRGPHIVENNHDVAVCVSDYRLGVGARDVTPRG